MARFQINLFGPLEVRLDPERIQIEGKKAQALLAYLALSLGYRASREQVCGLLWGERGEEQARGSLRQVLTSLRHQLTDGICSLVLANRDAIWLNPEAVDVDVHRFEQLVRSSHTSEELDRAAMINRGRLLDGLELREPAFEAWVESQRRHFERLSGEVCSRSIELLEKEGQIGRAIEIAGRLVALDGCDEAGHRALMRLHAANGSVGLALRQYQICRDTLKNDLGVTPSLITEKLRVEIGSAAGIGAANKDRVQSAGQYRTTPSVAILPFADISGDPATRLLAEGFAEDLRTELSRFRQLRVRASRFDCQPEGRSDGQEFEGGHPDYLVSGSVRDLKTRVRITVQLIANHSGQQLWAEHFDRDHEQIFVVQDEIVQMVVGRLVGRIDAAGLEHARRKHPSSLAAYECVLRGSVLPIGDPEAEAEARRLFERAITLDPDYGRAYAKLAYILSQEWFRDLGSSDEKLDHALELAKRGVALDDYDSVCHDLLGWIYLNRKAFPLAEYHKQRALDLAPNDPERTACMGVTHTFLGAPDRALQCFEQALVLDPFFERAWYWRMKGIAHFISHEYELAILSLERSPNVPLWVEAYLAASHAMADRQDLAQASAANVLRRDPNFSAHALAIKEPFRRAEDRAHLIFGLRRAGLPA